MWYSLAGMRKAYHQVFGISVKELLRRGVLYPAIDHIDPNWIPGSCSNSIDNLVLEMHHEDRAVFEGAIAVLEDIVQSEASLIEKYQREEGIEGKSRHSELSCFDILANDFDKVFCSLFNWVRSPRLVSGFVFDADFLIENGAAVREVDLLEDYQEGLKTVISEQMTPEEYRQSFAQVIRDILNNYERTKEGAKKLLDQVEKHEKERTAIGGRGVLELVFPGPIPLKWAIEAWQDGKRVKR